ncbi:type-2 ice-structuring protein-like [Mytilus trossulus]|uniref:type-2 ice-structuring protein-like n=1 Tax=Mytilus trossulus TaxID=6551 RepID=UPI0030065651
MFKKLTCKAGWSPKNEICYLQTTEQKYCQDAQNACLSIGGNPAEFYSKEEMTNALTVITSNVYVSGSLQGGVFIWNVSGQQIDSSLWIPNEPAGGTCVQIWRDKKGLDALEDTHFVTVLCEQRLFRWV